MSGSRARRIEERLAAAIARDGKVTVDDFGGIQRDVVSTPGKRFVAACKDLALQPNDPLEQRALALLLAWDGEVSAQSAGAAMYEATLLFAARRAFEPVMGTDLTNEMLGGMPSFVLAPAGQLAGRFINLLIELVERRDRRTIGKKPADPDPWPALIGGAVGDATRDLRIRMGDAVEAWSWGRIHRLTLKHPMGQARPLNLLFNGPTMPLGGDYDTPFQAGTLPQRPWGAENWAPSYRLVADLANPANSVSTMPGGQSGHARSRHWVDFLPEWVAGTYHPHWLDREAIDLNLEGALRLEPPGP
jgi:penicillin amidase